MCRRRLFHCALALLLARLTVFADDHGQESSCANVPFSQASGSWHQSLLQVQRENTTENLRDEDATWFPVNVTENSSSARYDADTDDLIKLFEDVRIVATNFMRKAQATPLLDWSWFRKLWGNRRVWMHIGLWIIIPTMMVALALKARRFEQEIGANKGRIVPIAAASSMCVFLSIVVDNLGSPWHHFSPTTALITVVFVMDMGTLERFIIKVTLRTFGTVLGGLAAIVAAEFSDLCDHHIMIQVCCCFTVFVYDMVMAKKFNYMAYTFTMLSVTFALVFLGYVARGWPAVWERLFSVLVGVILAIFFNLAFSVADGGVGEVTSIVSIIQKSEQIFNRSLVALDFAFCRNTILAAPDDETVLNLGKSGEYQDEVISWFGFNLDANEDPNLEDLRDLARSTTFHDLPMDVTVSVMQAECRQCWADMKFIRAIFPHNFCGRRVFEKLPSFCSLPERAHPVFLQCSALAHSGAIAAEIWQKEGQELEGVRREIQCLQPHFAALFNFKLISQKSKHGPSEDDKAEVLSALKALVDGLERAQNKLNSIWTPPGTSRSSTMKLFDVLSISGRQWSGPPAACDKFHGFCQGLSLIIMDFSLFILCCIKLMDIDDGADDQILQCIHKLVIVGSIDISVLEAQMEAPLDIDSSDIVKNWRKRAKKAARAALQPLGLKGLVKNKSKKPGQDSKDMPGTHSMGSADQSQSLHSSEAPIGGSASHSMREAFTPSDGTGSESSGGFSV